ncbi:anhydro-N-acetylmuramic acid kinase [Curvivirga sp.]|uniref:anhydro-N-acetylmuramic acid kinase n=1 Tax=Curvivirga sp. TaxID=2856848 RepID=UPI003B5AF241
MTEEDINKAEWCIGLMSGTSLDGVDAALIKTDGHQVFEEGPSYYLAYPDDFRERLRRCFGLDKSEKTPNEIVKELTDFHIEAVSLLMEVARLPASEVGCIGFHGQTIHHDPDNGITVQIGDGQRLANALDIKVVYDFRVDDVAAGGEGAPLAPVYHRALADGLEHPVAILNIGGVANVTYLDGDEMIAFDTGAGNAFMDDWVLRKAGLKFDDGGGIARQGNVDQSRLASWFANSYFQRPIPKSLDRDQFKQVDVEDLSLEDGLATLAAFTVEAVYKAQNCCPKPPKRWLVCGGGRHNQYLMDQLNQRLDGDVVAVEEVEWDGDALEAQAFAFMAKRTVLGLPISFPKTTGVSENKTGGKLVYPK